MSFYAFQLHRMFIYSVASQSCFLLFPPELFGLLWGLVLLIGGALIFLADPMLLWVVTALDGNFTKVNLIIGKFSSYFFDVIKILIIAIRESKSDPKSNIIKIRLYLRFIKFCFRYLKNDFLYVKF